jgi:hypothetical protein
MSLGSEVDLSVDGLGRFTRSSKKALILPVFDDLETVIERLRIGMP